MKIRSTVHSAVVSPVAIKAYVGEGDAKREVDATVNSLVVELVSDDGVHGHTFRLVPASDAEMAELKALYAVGNMVEMGSHTKVGE